MRTGVPRTALEAVAWRRLAVSGWPWRATAYLLATIPVALVAAAGLAIPAVPWLVLAAGGFQVATIVTLILLGAVLVGALGPLVSIHAIAWCRWRLGIVDKRPARPAAHRPPDGAGPVAWLRNRYTDPAAWRETGYACLLATVTHALCALALLSALLVWVLISSPLIVHLGGGPVALVFGQIYTVRQADLLDSGEGRGVGYLLKDRVGDIEEFVAALRRVVAGGTVVDPQVISQLVRRRRDPLSALSAREREVLALLAEGHSNARIARKLVVTEAAVGKHVGNIFAKLRLPQTDDTNRAGGPGLPEAVTFVSLTGDL
jgi:DNA-binding CsgD family transcriptional regulator